MDWFRRERLNCERRRPPSGIDPLADALAEAEAAGPLRQRLDDLEPVLAKLPQWVHAEAPDDISGFDTVVTFDDDVVHVHVHVDPETDGLEGALGQQPGIEDVFAEDREVVYLRTRLALVDVLAATRRAIVDGRPAGAQAVRQAHRGRPGKPHRQCRAAAGGGRIRPQQQPVVPQCFHRAGGDGFVQVAFLAPADGELTDGTRLEGRVWVHASSWMPEAYHRMRPPEEFPQGVRPMWRRRTARW